MSNSPTSETEGAPAAGMAGRMRALALASAAYLTGNVVGQGLAVLLFPLYTRYLTPSDYGILGVTTAVSTLLVAIFALSLQGAVGRLYFETDSDEERRRLYGTILTFMLIVPGLLAIGVHVTGKLGGLEAFESVPYTPYLQYAVATAYLSIFLQLPISSIRRVSSRVRWSFSASSMPPSSRARWWCSSSFSIKGSSGHYEGNWPAPGQPP